MKNNYSKSISVIGGAGHVGFPLGIALASKGYYVNLIDKNITSLLEILKGHPPFMEFGAKKLLKRVIKSKKLFINDKIISTKKSKFVIISIGTPINKSLKPIFACPFEAKSMYKLMRPLKCHLFK